MRDMLAEYLDTAREILARRFLLRWLLANVVGWSCGLMLGSALLGWFGGVIGLLLAALALGVCAGSAQMLALTEAGFGSRWVVFSALGSLGAVLPVFLAAFALVAGNALGFAVMGAVFGLCFGAAQAWILRLHLEQDAVVMWMLVNALGGGLCGMSALGGVPFALPVCLTPGPLTFGLLTGIALVRTMDIAE